MKFIQKNLLAIAAVVLVVAGGGYYIASHQPTPKQNSTKTEATTNEAKKIVASLEIDDGTGVKSFDLTEGVGKTALEVTQKSVEVKTTGEGANAYVTSINGRAASADKKEYWELLVNGKSSEVGAGSYIVKEGDAIKWKISTY